MSLKTNVEAAECFTLSAAFAGSVTLFAAKASVAMADLLVNSPLPLDVNVLTVAGAPLAAVMASTSLTRMAGSSPAPKHKTIATVFGGMAVVLPVLYVSVFEDSFISYTNPSFERPGYNQQVVMPEPPTGGVFPS